MCSAEQGVLRVERKRDDIHEALFGGIQLQEQERSSLVATARSLRKGVLNYKEIPEALRAVHEATIQGTFPVSSSSAVEAALPNR